MHEVAEVQARFDEERAGEIRRQLDEIKGVSKGLFETLFTHPGQFGTQLGSTIRAAVLSPITSGLGDLTSRALHPLIFGATGTGGIAGTLRGAFGGQTDIPIGAPANPARVIVVGDTTSAGVIGVVGGGFGRGGGTVSQPIGSAAMMAMLSGLAFAGQTGGGGGGGVAGPGQVTYGPSEITGITDSGIIGGYPSLLGPGGTSGFSGSPYPIGGGGGAGVSGGAGGGGAFTPSGLRGLLSGPGGKGFSLSSLKGTFFNSGSIATSASGAATTAEGIGGFKGSAAGVLTSQGAASLYLAAGVPLATAGIAGQRRGTAAGVLESTAGGALTGAGIGTMILPGFGTLVGAGIGAAAGLGIGVGEVLAGVESPRNEAKRLVKQQYGVSINNPTADQIVGISRNYGNHVSLAVRSPEVRQMLGLYAAGTGQSLAPSASGPHGASLVESGGSLFQNPVMQYGRAYSYQSSLPVYGGGSIGGGTQTALLANPGGPTGSGGPTYLSFNFDGKSAGDALAGDWVTPSFVANRQASAWRSSEGRVQSAMALADPTSIVS